MYAFDYVRAGSLDEAVKALQADDEAVLMAGGHTLIPTLKQRLARPTRIVDISALGDLKGIKADGNGVVIGAACTHGEVARSADVRKAIPALADLAGHIGDPQVRNRGTIGGSIANNDPAADYPAAVVALDATVHTNKRKIAGADFFTGLFETALDEGEIVTGVAFKKPEKAAYMKFRNPASRYAMVGVFVAKSGAGVKVAVTGAGACVFRVEAMEKALAANFSPDAVKDIKVSADGLNEDIHGSAEYRAHLVTVMARRAVEAALK